VNARTLTLPPGVLALRQRATDYWRSRAPRERLALGVVGAFLAVVLVWLLFVQPAWRVARDAPAQLDRLEGELQQMQRLAAESQTLRSAVPVPQAQAAAAVRAATERLADKARLSLQGDRASVTFNGVSAEALRGWLLEVRSAARARPAEAQLTRGPLGFSGTLVLSLGTNP
jgi:general secretion pathway protein M